MTTTQEGCLHHWLINPPSQGIESTGRCKKCELVKQFTNVPEEKYSPWSFKKRSNIVKKRS